MENDHDAEAIANQAIDSALATIPAFLEMARQDKEMINSENLEEFVCGIIVGMAFGMISAISNAQGMELTPNDHLKIKKIIFKNILQVRKRISQ
ncbi:MAG: hypothetical protein OXC46_09910 [Thaumarchaeota archaeon]|nr:hypothetical protein [Nitrososphaerota archaeon]